MDLSAITEDDNWMNRLSPLSEPVPVLYNNQTHMVASPQALHRMLMDGATVVTKRGKPVAAEIPLIPAQPEPEVIEETPVEPESSAPPEEAQPVEDVSASK